MKVEVELKKITSPARWLHTYVWGMRSVTPELYNRIGLGPTVARARASLTKMLPGGVDYEFEIVGF